MFLRPTEAAEQPLIETDTTTANSEHGLVGEVLVIGRLGKMRAQGVWGRWVGG